jgi:hypothetical protein
VADDRDRETKRTIIVADDGRRGSTGIILLVALILIVLAVLFFAGVFNRGDDRALNVQVNTPDVNVIVPQSQVPVTPLPQTQVPPPVNVNVVTPPIEQPPGNLSNTETSVTNSG